MLRAEEVHWGTAHTPLAVLCAVTDRSLQDAHCVHRGVPHNSAICQRCTVLEGDVQAAVLALVAGHAQPAPDLMRPFHAVAACSTCKASMARMTVHMRAACATTCASN